MTQFLKRNLSHLPVYAAGVWMLAACQSAAPVVSSPAAVAATSATTMSGNPALWPKPISRVAKDPAMEKRIDALIAKMSLEQKVGQTIQPEIRHISLTDVSKYHIGSVLNGGGSFPGNDKFAKAQDWVALADGFYKASMQPSENGVAIPIMWGTDAVHGHNNVIGATLYPHNIALGAANNPDLIKQIGAATAREIGVTGIGWSFAPTVAVARDARWGRTYESYAESPEIVKAYAGKMVEGLQGEPGAQGFLSDQHVIATAKHYIGDGGTQGGIDRGQTDASEAELVRLHAQGYVSAIESGVQTVMASFSSWRGDRMHGHKYLLTDILKDHMGFDGLVVGDWSGHEFVPGCTRNNCAQAINAGIDIFMVPEDWKLLYENTLAQARSGEIPLARLDDAVRRILRVKMRAGLFDRGAPSSYALAGKNEVLGAAAHREIARQAVRESLVLLKNKHQLLPIKAGSKILLAGDGADDIGKQAGGWSISWQGTGNVNSDFPGATSIYQGMAAAAKANGSRVTVSVNGDYQDRPDVAVVVFGENPYAEMQGDISKLDFASDKELQLLKKFKAQGIPVVSLFITGRPLWVNPELNASDAFAVIWQPGTEGAGVADVIMRDAKNAVRFDFKGKLSFAWPARPDQAPSLAYGKNEGEGGGPLFPRGYGLTYADKNSMGDDLSEAWQLAKQSAQTATIFKNRTLEPWQLMLADDLNHSKTVTSNVASLGAISYRAVDRLVQEDAIQLQWNGKAAASAGFFAKERVDYSALAAKALVFDVRVKHAPTAEVKLAMNCGTDCLAERSITQALRNAKPDQWETLSISMACFATAKLDMLLSPFALSTSGELDLVLHHVRIEAVPAPSVRCP
ncbi:glycoside hydrolase family 3 protein [Paucibacter sp. KCTC 42545]|uniref:glycoside hydrolase family 3 protein n=1 Tax=Paucibacter sp. KCTC 42545 TaxID=1768242 RepID=UPI000733B2C1|nr:glycoside hydrolase family 3 N-terminal domain-containing protein [Paucibacter sp. KCTC 42545]ALT76884.1 beta-glucosidase [Paucibacter sp. KCTC 42545]